MTKPQNPPTPPAPTPEEHKRRVRASLEWALVEHAGLLARLAR